MYPSLFGLSRRPFSSTPDPDCLVSVGGMSEATRELERCARGGQGIGILTAPAGLGKTVLCRKLADNLRGQFATVFLPNANFPTRRSLLQAILYEMGHPYLRLGEQELRLEFASAVRDLPPEHAGLVVIVDEAHLLHNRLLEELRTATHLVQDGEMLVRLILSGQLELEERLVKKDLAAINQRIVCHVTLSSLTMAESEQYLKERLASAGGNFAQVFEPEAVRMICQASDGNARCLNQLSDQCLVLAGSKKAPRVNADHVLAALDDLKQLPLHWNDVSAPRPKATSSPNVKSNIRESFIETEIEDESQTAFIEFGAEDEELAENATAEEIQSLSDDEADSKLGDTELIQADAGETESPCDLELSWDEEEIEATEILSPEDLARMGVETDVFPETMDEGFTEELVYDHYTELEKGLLTQPIDCDYSDGASEDPVGALRVEEDAFPRPPASSVCPDLTVIEPLPSPGEEWQPEDLAVSSSTENSAVEDIPQERKPAVVTDKIDDPVEDSAPMLAVDSGLETLLAEVSCNADSDEQSAEFGLVIERQESRTREFHPEDLQESYLLNPSETSPLGLEEHIAQMVLDAYADLQPLIWDSTQSEPMTDPLPVRPGIEPIREPGDATPYQKLRENLEQAIEAVEMIDQAEPELIEYDIVMPDDEDDDNQSEPRSRMDRVESDSSLRPYQNLFSKIRRQQRAG